MIFFLLSYSQALSEKRSTLKGKNWLPKGANSFLSKKTLTQKGDMNSAELPALRVYPFPLRDA